MSQEDLEYTGMVVDTWDLFRGDTSQWSDRPFYKGFIEEYGQPAVDIGCATGRLVLDYLAEGIDIDGVDVSPEMIAIAREKARKKGLKPNLYVQPIEALELPRTYRTILVPSSTFQLLTDPETAREAMRRMVAHLEPGGALVMPFMILWTEGQPLEEEAVHEANRVHDNALVRRISRSRYDPPAKLEYSETVFQVFVSGEMVAEEYHRRAPATRWYALDEAVDLYHEAGLGEVKAYSSFTRQPYQEGDELFTVVGVKTG
jgi:ubiquinone/menaquinone biosynthesis C-methylase UbiE